jgi:hypothetical protein
VIPEVSLAKVAEGSSVAHRMRGARLRRRVQVRVRVNVGALARILACILWQRRESTVALSLRERSSRFRKRETMGQSHHAIVRTMSLIISTERDDHFAGARLHASRWDLLLLLDVQDAWRSFELLLGGLTKQGGQDKRAVFTHKFFDVHT